MKSAFLRKGWGVRCLLCVCAAAVGVCYCFWCGDVGNARHTPEHTSAWEGNELAREGLLCLSAAFGNLQETQVLLA